MLKAIFNWFTGKPLPGTEAPPVSPEAAPYKIETPPPIVPVNEVVPVAQQSTRCGCGRSQTGYCVGLHKLTAEQWSVHPDNPQAVKPQKKKAPAKKATSATAEKPAKARKPRTPKQ